MGQPDLSRPRPPYVQVADALLNAIREGRYAPGAALPSYKALANEYGVAVGTAQSAVGRLREQGIVVTRHGAGSIVRPDLDPADLNIAGRDVGPWPEVLRSLQEITDRLKAIEAKIDERR
ncbi:GntR family transcriptional regulator [Amycolatopsis sp. FDAARGOS 1241]|uniref:GntR family transcriptional regulator n=1 Tax=Amycolatopsis sp. FDAARGOS 1241 TaxID=2778070 RepID=UPI001951A27E|nr:winged helix-turn-helix domain-containing protein [Amycolatopsis sp. FDAARGOS 1241]QRP48863.1 winged helix-turn-helix transcriptional regulator [Amycolatopsis sp. FDAARGOS 1241]